MNNNAWDMQCPKCKFFSQDKNNKYGVTYCDKH